MNKVLFKRTLVLLLVQFVYVNNTSAKTSSITVNFTELINGLNVTYAAAVNSTTFPVEYFWDYGDGNESGWQANNQTQHLYAAPGVYLVKLIARNTENETDSLTRAITLANNPVANFNYSPDTIYYGQPVQFTDISTSTSAPITNWAWDFGFGFENYQQNPVRRFANGAWNVTLKITNSLGQTSTKTKILIVRSAVAADFSYSPDTVYAGTPVQFSDHSTNLSGTFNGNGYWEFGNWLGNWQGSSYDANPTHTYTLPGIYEVWHTVSNTNGETDTIIKAIQVLDADRSAIVDFSYSAPAEPGVVIQFTDQSIALSGVSVVWNWDFGDGATATTSSPSHYYVWPGTYDVSLILGNSNGKWDTLVKRITLALHQEERNICPGGTVLLTAPGSTSSYLWMESSDNGVSYRNLSEGSHYSGTHTSAMSLTNVLSSMYGYKYKCLLSSGFSNHEYTIKLNNEYNGNGAWESFLNWSCGMPPDENTDVVIASGTITVNSNVICRSLTVLPGANIVVSAGYNITITH